ncbi:MAG TPA: CAP domain-containing protein, partial [Candidatus Limnocylindrales bacterium]|nr:CAP domain-containing protein [Candidatus Limnocylindrales bacterium]
APWHSVELYYLNLLNCTHTGGWVNSNGSCTGRGSNGHAPLKLSSGISTCATRPWARYLAVNGLLEHYGPTGPGDRLRACGYTSPWWGENLGQWDGDPYTGAIKVVQFFQSEKASNGGHWRNLMSTNFHSIGVGIWVSGGRAIYNTDFYGPG